MEPEETDAERLEAIRERAVAATPGPWYGEAGEIFGEEDGPYLNWISNDSPWGAVYDQERVEADARFSAHARDDVPWLLGRLDECREDRDRLRAALRTAETALLALNQHHTEAHHGGALTELDERVAAGLLACREGLGEDRRGKRGDEDGT